MQRIEAQSRADSQRLQAAAEAEGDRLQAEAAATGLKLKIQAELEAMEDRRKMAAVYSQHAQPLRLEELAVLREPGKNGKARLYLCLDGPPPNAGVEA
jgi:regulator of protease activity HflC (stomatin/prohibitin superfamily)